MNLLFFFFWLPSRLVSSLQSSTIQSINSTLETSISDLPRWHRPRLPSSSIIRQGLRRGSDLGDQLHTRMPTTSKGPLNSPSLSFSALLSARRRPSPILPLSRTLLISLSQRARLRISIHLKIVISRTFIYFFFIFYRLFPAVPGIF